MALRYEQNKYGIERIAEKKLRELLVTVLENRNRTLKLELFARFMGISRSAYSNNDLYMFYKIN